MAYDMKGCSQRIRQLRKSFGWTQLQFAEMMDMSYSSIVKIENTYQGVTVDALLMMKDLFHVSIDYLLTGEEYDPQLDSGLQQIIDIATQLRIRQGSSD